MRGITALILCVHVTLPRPVGAIELSLEENRAERGNIGYIDMQRLFKAYPETIRAKENFEELVRQAEEQLNLRKVEILRLRNELSQLKIEREFIAKTPLVVSAAPAPAPLPQAAPKAPSASTATLAAPALSTSTAVPAASTSAIAGVLPGFSAPASTEGAKDLPPAVSTAAAASPAVFTATSNPALAEIDARIALKAQELSQKEEDFKAHQAATEKTLLDLESKKTEIILGKIHKAVQEVARKEGVSVVVDKSSILFGHDAVDLTEKVLKHLKGS